MVSLALRYVHTDWVPSPDAASVPENEPHQQRQAAESFGSDPERYDRARPRYPDILIVRIAAAAPLVVGWPCSGTPASRQKASTKPSPGSIAES